MELLAELHGDGAPEAAVMEAYLDWRLPGWRDDASEQAGRRSRDVARRATPTA